MFLLYMFTTYGEIENTDVSCSLVKLLRHEWKFRRTRNAVGTRADRQVFSTALLCFPNFHISVSLKKLDYELKISIT